MNEKRILILGHAHLAQHSLDDYLSKQGYVVSAAQDDVQGMTIAQEQHFDIVLLDLQLPHSFQVIETLHREQPALPIILVSEADVLDDVIDAMRCGAWDYVRKPIRGLDEVDIVIQRVLEKAQVMLARQQAERALREQTALLNEVFEHIEEGIGIVDVDESITFCNPAFARIFETPLEDLVGRNLFSLFDQDARAFIRQQTAQRRQGKASTYELSFIAPQGRHKRLRVTASPRFGEHGDYVGAFGVVLDITPRWQMEQALRRERGRAQKYLEVAEVILVALDADGKITLINRKGCSVLGYAEDELIGQDWLAQCVPADAQEDVQRVFDQLMAGEIEPVERYRNQIVTKSGDRRLIAWHNTILKDDAGHVVGILGSGEDITEQVRIEQAMQRQNMALTARNAVAHALSGSLDLPDLLDEALSQVIQALGVSGGLIALLDERSGQLTLYSCQGLPDVLVERLNTHGFDGTLCHVVHREKTSLIVEDLRGDAPADSANLLEMNLRSYGGARIMHKDRSLGVICLVSDTPSSLSNDDRDLLMSIGRQIGMAVENARLFQDVIREREIAQTLLDTVETLSKTLRLDKLLEHVLDELHRVVPYDTASVALINEGRCWIMASRGLPQGDLRGFIVDERPLVRQVVRDRQPVIVSDAQEIDEGDRAGCSDRTRSWLGLPLIHRDEVIGVLMIDSRFPDVYNQDAARLAFAFAHQVALAIEKSRLYEQARAQLRESALLHRVTAALSSTLDADQILSYIARSLCEVLSCTSAEVYVVDQGTEVARVAAAYVTSRATERERSQKEKQVYALADIPSVAMALERRQPTQLTLRDPEVDPRARVQLEARGAQATLVLPMIAHDRLAGFVQLWDSDGFRRFTKGEIASGETLARQAAVALENARLLTETRKFARQMQALYETSSAMASLDEENVVYTILESVYRTVNCDYVLLASVDEASATIRVQHSIWQWEFDVFPEWVETTPYPLDHPGILADVYRTGCTEIVDTWDERFDRETWRCYNHEQLIRLFVPIKIRDVTMGVLEVGCDKSSASDDVRSGGDKMQMVSAFADQAAVALQNARLFKESQRRVRELRLLHDVSLAAASGVRLEDTLQAAVETLLDSFENVYVLIALLDYEADTLYQVQVAGTAPIPDEFVNLRVPIGEGIIGWVARYGEAALVPDVRRDPRYLAIISDTRSELCVPLSAGALVIGVLNLESPELNAFSEGDVQLLSTLASNLAVLVERARLFEEIESTQQELQQRAKALEEANVRLKELDRLKSQFLANMSHELRTPLNSIIGFSEVLVDGLVGELKPDQKECVEDIRASGVHLLALINDVLDLSKIEAQRMELKLRTFDVADVLDEVRATIVPLTEKKSQRFKVEIAEKLPPLTADRVRLRQVLLNLLSNAHKFTPEEGCITLTCRLADDTAMIFSVSDTGIGIKPAHQEMIFEEFRQVDGSSTREIAGTGLGLAISRRLVELHDGYLWVESEYGRGSTFYCLLPVSGPQAEDRTETDQALLHDGGKKVLIVEDDRQFSNLLALHLRQEGYTPIQRTSGKDILQQVRELAPVLITLDIRLPDQDGWDVLSLLKSDPQAREIPVLVISALEEQGMAHTLGAADYLVKPIRWRHLRSVLQRLLSESIAQHTILIIDDNPDIIAMVQEMLEPYTVLAAQDGETGITIAQDKHPDIILLDLMLPGKSGFEVLAELQTRTDTADIPVIVLTAKTLTEVERRQLDAQVEGLIYKTAFSAPALLEKLSHLEALHLRT
ncbi:MAG TPA: response regulator [Chloroflexi bacterium]|nr:response regulator [Chloroflexota bacterium]